MTDREKRTARAEWAKRVARWGESGLSGMEFAAEIGVNAGTLRQWKYRFNRGQGDPARRARPADVASFVEVQTRSTAAHVGMFQLELGGERRLHIPSNFDEAALRRLLSLLVQS